jgi:hypothetical protein
MRNRRSRTPRTLTEYEAQLARTEAQRARWQGVVDEAASLHGFEYSVEDWPRMAVWYSEVPSTPPTPREQDRWLSRQRVLASLRSSTQEAAAS